MATFAPSESTAPTRPTWAPFVARLSPFANLGGRLKLIGAILCVKRRETKGAATRTTTSGYTKQAERNNLDPYFNHVAGVEQKCCALRRAATFFTQRTRRRSKDLLVAFRNQQVQLRVGLKAPEVRLIESCRDSTQRRVAFVCRPERCWPLEPAAPLESDTPTRRFISGRIVKRAC